MPVFENKFHLVIPKIIMPNHKQDAVSGEPCVVKNLERLQTPEDGQDSPTLFCYSPEIRCSPSPCVFDDPEGCSCLGNNLSPLRTPSPNLSGSPEYDSSPRTRRRSLRSPSPSHRFRRKSDLLAPGYEQYQKSLLEVPVSADYGDASSDDLSSEWESDVPDVPQSGHSKVRWYFQF